MQASVWSSAGLCITAADQDQSRKPSYWSDCSEWSNGLDAFLSRDLSQKAKACAKGLAYAMYGAIRNGDGTT